MNPSLRLPLIAALGLMLGFRPAAQVDTVKQSRAEIAFGSNRGGNWDIYLVDVGGSREVLDMPAGILQ